MPGNVVTEYAGFYQSVAAAESALRDVRSGGGFELTASAGQEWYLRIYQQGIRVAEHDLIPLLRLQIPGQLPNLTTNFIPTRSVKGQHTCPSPVIRGRTSSKHHLITDGHGTPLAVLLTGGIRKDVTQILPLLDANPAVPRPDRPA